MRPAEGLRNLLISRRMFLQAASGTAASLSFGSHRWLGSLALAGPAGLVKSPPVVRTAFVYPPTKDLDKVGYYSWPGSTFDAEGRQRQYMARLEGFERSLGMRILADRSHLDTEADATRFISEVKADPPDGLLLVPFKKGHWPHVTRIVEETGIPTVILASLGILLVGHVREMYRQSGVYMINSLDNLDAVEQGLRMMTTEAAYALFRDDEVGSLRPGKAADMIILDHDPRVVEPDLIRKIDVLMTMVAGQVEWCTRSYERLCPNTLE